MKVVVFSCGLLLWMAGLSGCAANHAETAFEVIGEIETGDQPIVVCMHPDGKRVFVSNEVSATVTVLKQRQN